MNNLKIYIFEYFSKLLMYLKLNRKHETILLLQLINFRVGIGNLKPNHISNLLVSGIFNIFKFNFNNFFIN